MFYKTALTTILLIALSNSVLAENPLKYSGHLKLTSDYISRGLTYTNNEPAIQGSFKITHESGVYGKILGSNVNLLENDTVNPKDRANLVVFLYAGYGGQFNKQLSYDVNVLQYWFPGADKDLNYDLTEFNASLNYRILNIDLEINYAFSPEFFLASGKSHYVNFSAGHTWATGIGLSGHVGRQTAEEYGKMGWSGNYNDYSVSLSFPVGDFDGAIYYTNTDLDNADDIGADGTVRVTLTKNF